MASGGCSVIGHQEMWDQSFLDEDSIMNAVGSTTSHHQIPYRLRAFTDCHRLSKMGRRHSLYVNEPAKTISDPSGGHVYQNISPVTPSLMNCVVSPRSRSPRFVYPDSTASPCTVPCTVLPQLTVNDIWCPGSVFVPIANRIDDEIPTSPPGCIQSTTDLTLPKVVCRPSPSPITEPDKVQMVIRTDRSPIIRRISRCSPLVGDSTNNSNISDNAYSQAATFLPDWDLERLQTVYSRLSFCGFYFGKMSISDASAKLMPYPVGTFLLRDSSDSRYLFSLSVKTGRGTTSIRIVYQAGLFRLDSDQEQVYLMPTFECILLLIRYYVHLGARQNNFVFLEGSGRRDTPVFLRRALEETPSSLGHLCRKKINGILNGRSIDRLHLVPSLKNFVKEYPYDL